MSAGLLSTYLVRGILRNGPKALDNPNLSPALREELEQMVKQAEEAEARLRLSVQNTNDIGKLGKNGAPIRLKIIDNLGNEIGEITRSLKQNKAIYSLKINNAKRPAHLEVSLLENGNIYDLPVNPGEKMLYGDLFIPSNVTSEFSGIGNIILDDAFAFFKNNPKFGQVDGTFGVWLKDSRLYESYGGESVNLSKFWNTMSRNGGNIEEAALSTFTGKWAEKNGFTKVVIENIDEHITPELVMIKYLNPQ